MRLARGRIVRAGTDGARAPDAAPKAALPRGRRVDRLVVEAEQDAEALLARARDRATEILRDAERRADDIRLRAEATGRAEGLASIAGLSARLHRQRAAEAEGSIDQIVDLARLLAERLVGEQLRADPAAIEKLARGALDEARGANRARLFACPEDAAHLRSIFGQDPALVIDDDASLHRGDVRLETDIGSVEARVGAQLDRLARRLRESLE